jgi:hypothetical protein
MKFLTIENYQIIYCLEKKNVFICRGELQNYLKLYSKLQCTIQNAKVHYASVL